ncbi:MAG: YbaB/EbfC family nucleoid-associated protein [Acidobacteria bacterium]|nr:YbaB/EbfC family nucleoid-associated protein [Acidobacteriota bacterium]
MRNLQDMMNQVKKIQGEMQQQLEGMRVEGSAGGGMVTVQMSGSKRILSVKIDPEVVKGGDAEMLQDLIQAAVNESLRKVDEAVSEKLGSLMGGMLGGFKLPGLF